MADRRQTGEEWLNELAPIIDSAAGRFAAYYRGHVEKDDVAQELAIWVITHVDNLNGWADTKSEAVQVKMAAKSLRHAAKEFCAKQKKQALGYTNQENWHYGDGDLDMLLTEHYQHGDDALTSPPVMEDAPTTRQADPASGNNWLVSIIDLRVALEKADLDAKDNWLLYRRYYQKLTLREIGEEDGMTAQSADYRIRKVKGKILDQLGGFRPDKEVIHPGCEPGCGRRSMTNARARAITASQYEEE